jgi:hypothetical protein
MYSAVRLASPFRTRVPFLAAPPPYDQNSSTA